jgi:ribonuclease E
LQEKMADLAAPEAPMAVATAPEDPPAVVLAVDNPPPTSPVEPDPAEIVAPPTAPRRGWWRRSL